MHSSSHLGVSRIKSSGRFLAKIQIDGKIRHVGTFCDEEEAAAAYRAAEAKIQEDPSWVPSRRAFSSEHVGVYFNKHHQKWKATLTVDGKKRHLGYYEEESDAARAVVAARIN